MSKLDDLELVALAVLLGCLCLSIAWRRRTQLRAWLTEWPERRDYRRKLRRFIKNSPHTGLDASAIFARVDQLRHEHVEAARARFYQRSHRQELLASARKTITEETYFRPSEPSDSREEEQKIQPELRRGVQASGISDASMLVDDKCLWVDVGIWLVLALVLIIGGLLIAAAAGPFIEARKRAMVMRTTLQLQSCRSAAISYRAYFGRWPNTPQDLVTNPQNVKFISPDPPWTDAWGHQIVFIPFSTNDGYGRILSYGRDGLPGGIGLDADMEVHFP